MCKENPNIRKILKAKETYSDISNSRVSWRKKSSYRKKIKRRSSKLNRLGDKIIIKQEFD